MVAPTLRQKANMNSGDTTSRDWSPPTEPRLQIAVCCMVAGLLCFLFYLWWSFGVWTFGIGILLGIPLVVLAITLYLWAVIRDLRRQGLL